jgi:NSS family neurotransmitter:Na+ symporter
MGSIIFIIGIPSALSFGVLQGYELTGKNFFSMMESLTNNYMLPLGGVLISLFVGYVWGSRFAIEEIKQGNPRFIFGKIWIFLLRYFCPLMMVQIRVLGRI